MSPEIDEKVHYERLHAQNAFREPRLYPRNWDMTSVPSSKKDHVLHRMDPQSEKNDMDQSTLFTNEEVSFDEWQINRQFSADAEEHSGYFTAF